MASTRVVSISGRQRVERLGLYFAVIAKHRRSVYQQLDGRIELADLCTCFVDWTPDFTVHALGELRDRPAPQAGN